MGRLFTVALVVFVAAVAGTAALGGVEIPEEEHEPKAAQSSKPAAGEQSRAVARPAQPSADAGTGPAVRVTIDDFRFRPAAITARAGQPIVWTNRDDVAHNVQIEQGAAPPPFASSRMPPGADTRWVAAGAGKLRYVCTLHPTVMSGTVTVTGRG